MPPDKPLLSYRLISYGLFFVWIVHAGWQAIKNRQLCYLWQRLGLYHPAQTAPCIWLHAASVGEVELLKPLVEHLQNDHPLLVTTFTASGFQHAGRVLSKKVRIAVLPIDLLPISRRFMRHSRIKLALIAETELWPETLYQASRQGIPLIQINARLSNKSLNTSGWTNRLLKQTLSYFDEYLTRTEQDVMKLICMGAERQKIVTAGNLKYANLPSNRPYQRLIPRPYILFASTHDPEEMQFASLIKQSAFAQLAVIAPRHPLRSEQILKSLKPLGLKIQQRSRSESIHPETQIYLADTLGELKAFMAHASLVIMGGSFIEVGGHNVLEPASLGKAVITGPSDDNIEQDVALLLEQNAIIQVSGMEELAQKIEFLLHNPAAGERLSENALRVMDAQSHVLQNYLRVIKAYL